MERGGLGGVRAAMLLKDVWAVSVSRSWMPFCSLATAKWLASEVLKIVQSGGLGSILLTRSREDPAATRLSLQQQHLVGVVCRLPDVLANRLGRALKEGLLPKPYFGCVGEGVLRCLEGLRRDCKGEYVASVCKFC